MKFLSKSLSSKRFTTKMTRNIDSMKRGHWVVRNTIGELHRRSKEISFAHTQHVKSITGVKAHWISMWKSSMGVETRQTERRWQV